MKKALFFSVLFHMGLIVWLQSGEKKGVAEKPFFPKPIPPRSIDVRTMKEKEFRQLVETLAAKNSLSPEDRAEFLGERTQRVKEQTRSNRFGSPDGGETLRDNSTAAFPEKLEFLKGLWKLPDTQERARTGAEVLEGSMDPLNSHIAVSSKTLLNTDEYVYASFFNRVKREIGPRWEPKVQKFLQTTLVLIDGVYSTRCVFWLDRDGSLRNVELLEPSGVKELDALAVEAIWDIKTFPNPPTSLLDSTGLHRVEMGFLVSYAKHKYQLDYLPDSRFKGRR
ncbi:TonB C-terminal domain-containing protein [bacterium]|nr:TonB C-terminal domain-containing protein [bacterium]